MWSHLTYRPSYCLLNSWIVHIKTIVGLLYAILCDFTPFSVFRKLAGKTNKSASKNLSGVGEVMVYATNTLIHIFFHLKTPGIIASGHRSSVNFRGQLIFARKMCIKNQQNARILHDSCPKIYQNTRIFMIFARKKCKIPEFHMIFARKNAQTLRNNCPKNFLEF